MATYCAKFTPNFNDLFAPLRELTKKDKPFHWSAPEEQSFKRVKSFSQVPKSWLTLIPRRKQSSQHMLHQQGYQPYWCRSPQPQTTNKLLHMLAEHSHLLNTGTHKMKKRHLPLFGQLRNYTYVSMKATSSSSQIASLYNSYMATRSPSHQQELSIGVSVSKAL